MCFVVVSLNSISTTDTPTGGYGIRPYGLPIPLHSACRQLRRGGGTPPYTLPKKGTVGRPALWPTCPLPATVNLPCNPPTLTPQGKSLPLTREAGLSKNCIPALLRVQGRPWVARQLTAATQFPGQFSYKANGHGRAMLAPTRAFRHAAPTLNFTSNFTLAKSGKVCYNLIAYRFSGKYSRNPNQKRRVPPHVRTPVGDPCGFLW